MNFESYYPIIDAYLQGKLSLEERVSFEAEMERIPLLKEEVEKFRLEKQVLSILAQATLKSQIKEWQQECIPTEAEFSKKEINKVIQWQQASTKTRQLISFRRAAAAIFLLCMLSAALFQSYRFTNRQLVMHHLVSIQPEISRGDTDDVNDGIIAFAEKNYKKAIPLLSKIPPESPQFEKVNLYLGESYLHLKQYDQAIQAFRNVHDPKYKDLVEWNILISLLGANKNDTTFQTNLKAIIQNKNHYYHTNALHLQKDLNKFWRFIMNGGNRIG